MSNYDQPATWGNTSAALGLPGLIQTAGPHLQVGERLLGVFPLHLDQLLPLYDRPGHAKFHIWRGGYRMIRSYWHGESWSGWNKDSTAFAFWKAVRSAPQSGDLPDLDRFVMVLTDQRMVLLETKNAPKFQEPYKAQQLLELPRGTYRLRPEAPTARLTHRFDVEFADGSWIALMVNWTSKKYDAKYEEILRQISGLLAG